MYLLDHIVIAVADLNDAMCFFETELDIKIQRGGKHLSTGTHNAIFGLGHAERRQYIELLAVDPHHNAGINEFPMGLTTDFGNEPRCVSWALQCNDIDKVLCCIKGLNEAYSLGEPYRMNRLREDGVSLEWQIAFNEAVRKLTHGTIPFLINWGKSCHPTTSLNDDGFCESYQLVIAMPESEKIKIMLMSLGVDLSSISIQHSVGYSMQLKLHNRGRQLVVK